MVGGLKKPTEVLTSIRAVIFDLDGTLVETEELKALSYARAAVELCAELNEAEVIKAFTEQLSERYHFATQPGNTARCRFILFSHIFPPASVLTRDTEPRDLSREGVQKTSYAEQYCCLRVVPQRYRPHRL